MAILKSKTLPNGAVGNYWRILDIHIGLQSKKVDGTIGLFKDRATSQAGDPPLGGVITFSFPLVVADLVSAENVITWVYTKIMEIAETEVSVDITGAPIDPPAPRYPDIAGGTII